MDIKFQKESEIYPPSNVPSNNIGGIATEMEFKKLLCKLYLYIQRSKMNNS